jgi:hypothetical protein
MPKAKVGVVGLRDAGKSIFHLTLFLRPMPLDRPGVTLAFPVETQRVLDGGEPSRAQQLEAGKPPPPTALAHDNIVWELELPAKDPPEEWVLETMDAGGEFYAFIREEDVEQQAGPIDAFVTQCDAILYLIDAGDDKLLASQLGTLRQVLTFNKRKVKTGSGLKARPVCLVFTKAEAYIPKLGIYILTDKIFAELCNANIPKQVLEGLVPLRERDLSWEQLVEATANAVSKVIPDAAEKQRVRDNLLEYARVLTMNRDRAALVDYLLGREAGQQLHAFYKRSCVERGLYEIFPISCIHRNETGYKVSPKWMHEPIFWAVDRIHEARGKLDDERSKTRRMIAGVAFVMMLLAVFGVWLYGHLDAGMRHDEVQAWRDSHVGPEHAKAREEKGRELLTQTFVRFPFVSNGYLAAQRQIVADDKAKHHRFLYDGVVTQAGNLHREQGAPSLKAQVEMIEASADFGGPLNAEYVKLRDEKREKFHDYEFGLLKAQADRLAGQNQYDECFRSISSSFLMKVESWRPKAVALLEEKKKARLDGEMDRLTRLAKAVVEKTDQDSDDTELTAAVEDFGKTFLKDQAPYTETVQEMSGQVKERRELYRFNKLQAQLADLPADSQAQGRIAAIGKMPYTEWIEERKERVEKQRREAVRTAYKYRYTELCKKLDAQTGKPAAGSRVTLIESTTWTDLPDTIPTDFKSDIDQRLRLAKEEEEEYEVKDKLFVALDKMTKPEQAQKSLDLLVACRFRTGRYKAEIQERIEQSMVGRIRYAQDQKSDTVPGLCKAFLNECPDSKLKNQVQLTHDDWAWALATKGERDASLAFPERIHPFVDYLKIEYASRKASARRSIARLEREWDKKDYDHLQALSPIRTWDEFEKAEERAKTYLAGDRSVRTKKAEVETFLKSVQAYAAGVGGLELMIDEVNLSNATDLAAEDRPFVTVYLNRTLPAKFADASDLKDKLKGYPFFSLARTNERRASDVKYVSGFKMYSGEKKGFHLAFNVSSNNDKYKGFISGTPKPFDLGNALFIEAEGSTTKKLRLQMRNSDGSPTGVELDFEFVVRWKGSTLCDLKLSKYDE